MRDTISVTSSTQNNINKRRQKSKKSLRSRINKLKLSSLTNNDRISIDKNHIKNEQAEKAIPILAQAFSNGFFTEVNCRILPENLLDQLAQQVYQFVRKQGCGKTTLCKGLAQKVSIRMKELFNRFYFYELNAASLFSKWFSESSHNLSRFFDDITRICYDPLTFVIILIDEIESLSISRISSLSSNEPSDMLRVVNTLLTHIDRLKSFSNILVLTTSNLIEIIDQALIDRSDLILFIGPPSIKTTFHIYRACFIELIEKNLIYSKYHSEELKDKLWNLAKLSHGLSGRTLRKLPMIAFSHIQQSDHFIHPEQLFKAMHQQLIYQKNTNNYLQQFNNQ
ncbi:unnamed protein product [Rotaria sp. Silwood1]|nr:unnamed protein product [Rotaria sp. Silwood1]